jgi:broad specificity phosphatase PhoE
MYNRVTLTQLLLIRHAHHDYIGRAIAGWLPGVSLSASGRAEAAALPTRLSEFQISAIYSSPLERAMETAAPLAGSLHKSIEIRADLGEIRFGDFTGRTMADLDTDPAWHHFNVHRSVARAPGGEMMLESQARMVAELERIRSAYPDATVAVFSHSDIIRAAVLYYLGMPLDFYERIRIDPASITIVELEPAGQPCVVCLNSQCACL